MAVARSPQQPQEPQVRLEPSQGEQVMVDTIETIRQYLWWILGALVVLVVVLYLVHQAETRMDAAASGAYAALDKAASAERSPFAPDPKAKDAERRAQLEAVLKDHAGTNAAVEAELHLATLAFAAGNYAEAETAFVKFASAHAAMPQLVEQARLGEANALFEQNKLEAALAKYKALGQPDSATKAATRGIATLACYNGGLCAAVMGNTEDAGKLLDLALVSAEDGQAKEDIRGLANLVKIAPAAELRKLGSAPAKVEKPAAPAPAPAKVEKPAAPAPVKAEKPAVPAPAK